MALGSRLYPSGILQVPTYFDDYTTLTGAAIRLHPNYYLAKLLDEVTISPLAGGLAKREYSNGTLAVANSFDEVTLSNYPAATTPTFNTSTNRTFAGLYSNGRVGWSYSGDIPTGYDDGYTFMDSAVYKFIPSSLSWYMNNTAYTSLYVGTNGYITFNTGYTAYSISTPQSGFNGFWMNPGDQYQGTNGANGTGNTPSAIAYRKGVTSNGWQFFTFNMQGHQYANQFNDRSWEVNCFYNLDNSVQLVEFTYSPSFSLNTAYTGTAGMSTLATTFTASTTPAANLTLSFSSIDKGQIWTYAGQGSWSVGTF